MSDHHGHDRAYAQQEAGPRQQSPPLAEPNPIPAISGKQGEGYAREGE